MIFNDIYFDHGIERWNLGFPSPNYAGAFLSPAIPYLTIYPGCKHLKVLFITAELGAIYMLGKTGSRGAVIGLYGAHLSLLMFGERLPVRWWASSWILRLLGYTLVLALAGILSRLAAGASGADASVSHRLDIWRAGLVLMYSAPLNGWGGGTSGHLYLEWFQDPAQNAPLQALVSSYLTAGVEHGVPWFFLIMLACASTLLLTWQATKSRKETTLVQCAGASLVSWIIVNAFSTLFRHPVLWCLPSLSLAIICVHLYVDRSAPRPWKAMLWGAMAAALATSATLYGVAWQVSRCMPYSIRPWGDAAVLLSPANKGNGETERWFVWTDQEVLGATPGKRIRDWLALRKAGTTVCVNRYPVVTRSPAFAADKANVMLFGRYANLANGQQNAWHIGQLWIMHPTVAPMSCKSGSGRRIVVCLPSVDETGLNGVWTAWAKGNRAAIITEDRPTGVDMRTSWPQMAPQ